LQQGEEERIKNVIITGRVPEKGRRKGKRRIGLKGGLSVYKS